MYSRAEYSGSFSENARTSATTGKTLVTELNMCGVMSHAAAVGYIFCVIPRHSEDLERLSRLGMKGARSRGRPEVKGVFLPGSSVHEKPATPTSTYHAQCTVSV
ncbi:hypothetical protein E2C01_069201 [Portunus trituberculatus]|uniref:Uncharacterized protein n=1 Tax=Portunus trituberculatus TaxID=210409 RepID=A0A5B7HY86_PORTR|nr:hypothetical protein [Portunus trituberculatus]